jgi:hypothetical protein
VYRETQFTIHCRRLRAEIGGSFPLRREAACRCAAASMISGARGGGWSVECRQVRRGPRGDGTGAGPGRIPEMLYHVVRIVLERIDYRGVLEKGRKKRQT